MPPWAYSEEDSRRESLAITRTVPEAASSIAARKPATPAPITRKSQSIAIAILTTCVDLGVLDALLGPRLRGLGFGSFGNFMFFGNPGIRRVDKGNLADK